MKRFSVRLVLSHVGVAVLAGLAIFLVVQWLAPALFDESLRRAQGMATPRPGGGLGPGQGRGAGVNAGLRADMARDVTTSLGVGVLVAAAFATAFGVLAARRLTRGLGEVRAATRAIAAGHYRVTVPVPAEQELAELATDVQTLGTTLAETEERRVRLLGELAHELRTPLTVIDGYVEGMIDGVLPVTSERLGEVSDEVRRLRRLSDDLSALSRAEEGRLAIEPRPVDLAAVVAAAAERLRPQAEDAGLTLGVDASAPVDAVVDPDRLAQVVTNLVGNAIRATSPGGRVDVGVRAEATAAVVRVADTGEGLDAADLERVFERFYRVPGRRGDGHDGGSGIGLTIARGIVRAHGGDLAAASPGRGHGSTFTVRLPREGQPAMASPLRTSV